MQWMELTGIGLAAGAVGGLLGVGGSIVMIPAMTIALGPDQHLYQAAAMIVNFFVVTPAVLQHAKAGAVQPATVKRLLPLALLGVLAGVGVSELWVFADHREPYLRGLFGVFLLTLCAVDLYRLLSPGQKADFVQGDFTWRRAALVALPTGIVAGLFGVGGGVMAVPLQRRFLGIPIRSAIANSATVIIATSFAGACAKNYAYVTAHGGSMRSFALAAALIPTAMVGATLGSRLTHVLPTRNVKIAFFVLLALAAARMIYGALQSVTSGF